MWPWTVQDGRLPGAVNVVTQTMDGRLWVGTEFGLFWFDGVKLSRWEPPPEKQMPSQVITALAPVSDSGFLRQLENRAGNLWVGGGGGLYRWNSSGFHHYGPRTNIQAIAQAEDGSVIVPSAGGLQKVTESGLVDYSSAEALRNAHIRALMTDRDERAVDRDERTGAVSSLSRAG